MSQTWLDFIRSRRSIRRYEPRPVPRELILDLLEAARWSPSAHNRQPWRFVILESAEQKERFARAMGARLQADLEADHVSEAVIEADVTRSYDRITSAPLILVLCLTMADMDTYPDARRNHNENLMAVQSVAMAGQNILLTAHEAGLGACWLCAPLFVPDVVRDVLGLPEDWIAQGMLTIGYPAQERTKDRKPLEDVVLWR